MIDFTKVRVSGQDYVLVTERKRFEVPLLLLDEKDIKRLGKAWSEKFVQFKARR